VGGVPIKMEVGELFAGMQTKPSNGTTTVFKSVGIAAEDLAAAALVLHLSMTTSREPTR
jgi:ornithine cyclodeaminase/alanine dehydrogenase-like protein (mu-crystallin family)